MLTDKYIKHTNTITSYTCNNTSSSCQQLNMAKLLIFYFF